MKEFPNINQPEPQLSPQEYDKAKNEAIEKLKILLGDGEIEEYQELKNKFDFSRDEEAKIIAEALLTCLEFKDIEAIEKINENKIIEPHIINDLKRKIDGGEIEELKSLGLEI